MRRQALLAAVAGLATTAALAISPAAVAAAPPKDPRPSLTAADPGARAAAAADQAVSSGLDALRKGPDETYWRRAVTAGASGMFYVSYDRTYKGLPVVGGDAVVVTDSEGKVQDTTAASGPSPENLGIRPRVNAERAARISRGKLDKVDLAEAPRLVVLAWGAQPILAWETVVHGVAAGKPSKQHVFVDARSGAIADSYDEVRLSSFGTRAAVQGPVSVKAGAQSALAGSGSGYYNGSVTIDTSQASGTYRMVDTSRPGLQCGGQNGSAYTGPDDVWGNGQGTNLETACVDTLYGAQTEWKMLSEWLGRNGIDGAGRGFPARVGLADVNAYWNGSYTNFGRSQDSQRQVTPMDVVAHEYGHAIFQTTPGGAGSGNENGGINEGTGDIFGALTEHYAGNANDPADYEVGEEVNLVGQGPIRYMHDPSRVGDPNCWSSSIPNTEVHAAAGPLNHWFYLLAEGSSPGGGKPNSPICSGGPSSVTGIGIQKAGKIFMGALGRKTSSWRYANVRSASLAAAVELYGANSVECATTKAAWNAVSVPVQSGEPTCQAPSQDFSISTNPASGTVEPGQSATTTVGTQTTSGNAQTVNLTASGLPSGASASFSPASVTSGNSSTLTISTSAQTPAGTFTVTITGTGQTATHTATYSLRVGSGPSPTDPPDISLANVKAHVNQFGTIAANNGGNRRSTGPGYTASVTYIEQKLQAAGYTTRRQNCGSTCTSGAGPNLIADWPGGDTNQVIMAGAHLDGVSAGPGINDNASGSSALLEVALTLAAKNPTMAKHVRFGWWSDEEQGLNGSEGYVASLTTAERQAIQVYHNYDMVGSPNGGYFINNITTTAAQHLKAFYDALGLQPEENTEGANRSDDASFRNAGIATSGVAAGASYTKTTAQAAKWGGTAGQAYDRCYHAACDTVSNINDTVLDRAADAAAYAIWKLAVGTSTPGQDFSIATNPSSGSVQAGQAVTTQVTTQTTQGNAQTINLSASGLPSGATASFNPASVTSGNASTLTISTTASTPAGSYQVTITGAGASGSKTTVYSLTVQGTQPGRTFRNDTNYTIRDYTYIQSPITSTATGTAQSPVQLSVTSNHTCIEDLGIWLRGPNGTWYQLRAPGGTSCSVFGTRTFSVPVTQQAAGTWVLYIEDVYAGDTGILDWWSITV
ncbi:M28 family peptidase [Nonomuraea soli]|uniref:Zn-dependent metalloprotease/Zn-dependent M28 family amino/carboxypeptidase n=1 Tax=Nonomuraea soli TaxID=1032476 RepID=A0A7W0HNE3_9ACTN|nr:M28 family peptidase [Nonomuraea soli]MBA2889720.1 Zn-dependent metalloprotease/Zn-dependent M28 family amino/carboxypeptidase [Nonomuraea soli]